MATKRSGRLRGGDKNRARRGTFSLELDLLLVPLTLDQQEQIEVVFTSKGLSKADARRLIADWARIAQVGHQHALAKEERRRLQGLRDRRDVRYRRTHMWREADESLRRAQEAISKYAELREKLLPGWAGLQDWERYLIAQLEAKRHQDRQNRTQFDLFVGPVPQGRPPTPSSRLLEVLAAYFRKNGWPLTFDAAGLLYQVGAVTLGRQSFNFAVMRKAARTSLDYDSLEADAPKGVVPTRPVADLRRLLSSRSWKTTSSS